MSTGGKVPRRSLAPRTLSEGSNNSFHTLIHDYQYQKVPRSELPSAWDMGYANRAGNKESQSEAGWGNNSRSWNSRMDMFMNRIEQNTEAIGSLAFRVEDLKELIEKLVRDSPPTPKE